MNDLKIFLRNATIGLFILNIVEASSFFYYGAEWLIEYLLTDSGGMLGVSLILSLTGYIALVLKDLFCKYKK